MRETPLLKSVLEILAKEHKPLSVPNIQEKLKAKGLEPNKTTLYRMLEKLTQAEEVNELLLDSKVTYYELKTHHHHHFRCQECDQIRCIADDDLESEIHKLEAKLKEKGFTVEDHHFSLSGKCKSCT